MALLEIDDIHVFYDNIEALKGVSINVESGHIVSLVGANGAGKTTTLRTVSGLLHPRLGEIRFAGESLRDVQPHEIAAMGVRHVPEGRRIFARLTVAENLAMGAFVRGGARSPRTAIACCTLFPVLRERLGQIAGTLSGGEQQMVATARALMGRPRVLRLGRASMGLSPVMVERVFETIKAINEQGVTILLVEQNAVMALDIADEAYVMESGRIVLAGQGKDLLDDENVQRAYLGGVRWDGLNHRARIARRKIMRIVVLGGGVVGVTTAYELQKDGHEVVVFERNSEVASEASWGNAGMIAPGHSFVWSSPKAPMILLKSLFLEHQALRCKFSADLRLIPGRGYS